MKPTLLVGTGGQTLYTADAAETVLVKTISMVNAGGANVDIDVAVGDPTPAITNHYFVWNQTVLAGKSLLIDTWIVLQPGQRIWAVASLTNVAVVGCFGTELEGVAD